MGTGMLFGCAYVAFPPILKYVSKVLSNISTNNYDLFGENLALLKFLLIKVPKPHGL